MQGVGGHDAGTMRPAGDIIVAGRSRRLVARQAASKENPDRSKT